MKDMLSINELIYSILTYSLRWLEKAKLNTHKSSNDYQQCLNIIGDFCKFLWSIFEEPSHFFEMQIKYGQDINQLLQAQWFKPLFSQDTPPPLPDKRFEEGGWQLYPFFNALSQHYLLLVKHVDFFLDSIEIDHEDKMLIKKIKFFIKHYLDALSPSNFFSTNPQVIHETIQTQGRNLLQGFNHFLQDLEKNSPHFLINMSARDSFQIGINLAATPGKVIYRNAMMELIQYTPQTRKVREIPLLIVPPWINKYYILDLSPHNSLIRWSVQQGITVFVISWINPDANYAGKGLESYMNEGPLAAIFVVQKQLAIQQVNLLGFCIGGTLVACTLAYLKALNKNIIQSATLLASLIDFSDPGDLAVLIDEVQVSHLESIMQVEGFLDGRFMASAFNALKANPLIWSFFVKNYLQGKAPAPFDMLYWNADCTNLPARMHSEYLRGMYLHNNLINPGTIQFNQVPLDINQITQPTCFVATEKDHIAPWKTIYLGFQRMKGNKKFILGGSGHIAGIINPPINQKYGSYHNRNTAQSAQAWFETASYCPGSWWPIWMKWLKAHSGGSIPAINFDKLPLKGLIDAPGSYVLKTHF